MQLPAVAAYARRINKGTDLGVGDTICWDSVDITTTCNRGGQHSTHISSTCNTVGNDKSGVSSLVWVLKLQCSRHSCATNRLKGLWNFCRGITPQWRGTHATLIATTTIQQYSQHVHKHIQTHVQKKPMKWEELELNTDQQGTEPEMVAGKSKNKQHTVTDAVACFAQQPLWCTLTAHQSTYNAVIA